MKSRQEILEEQLLRENIRKAIRIVKNKKLKIKYDKSKPDGMPKKCLDISLAKGYGWRPRGDINKAFEETYKDFLKK